RRGRSGGSIVDGVSVVAGDPDELQGNIQLAGGHLGNLGVQALSHLHPAVDHGDRAVLLVDLDDGTGGIHGRRLLEADAVLQRQHGDAALSPAVNAVELIDAAGTDLELRIRIDMVPMLAELAEPERLAEVRSVGLVVTGGTIEVAAAN